jgi:hypothetical protein
MIACSSPDCSSNGWCHLRCVNLPDDFASPSSWYCPPCAERRKAAACMCGSRVAPEDAELECASCQYRGHFVCMGLVRSEPPPAPLVWQCPMCSFDAALPALCTCGFNAFGTMVACSTVACATPQFHAACVGLPGGVAPGDHWRCERCTQAQAQAPTFCLCGRPEFGKMIQCDGSRCPLRNWCHYGCVDLSEDFVAPDVWLCPRCKATTDSNLHCIPRFPVGHMPSEREICTQSICILPGLLHPLDAEVFDRHRLAQVHGEAQVDVLLQAPSQFGYGFPVTPRTAMTLAEYVAYMDAFQRDFPGGGWTPGAAEDFTSDVLEHMGVRPPGELGPLLELDARGGACPPAATGSAQRRDKPAPAAATIKFCVNVDVGKWPEVVRELQKLPAWAMWDDALMRHLPPNMPIPGVTQPQLYFKVPGVWTGGHEENARLYSVNNNHGPNASVWGAVAPEHVPRLRQVVLEEFKYDIYMEEGLFFPNVKFLVDRGVPVMLGVQRPGDTVVLNGGTLHWVCGAGFAVNSSWNFGVRSKALLESAFERDAINQALKARTLVPLHTLVLRVLLDCLRRGGSRHHHQNDNSGLLGADAGAQEAEFLRFCAAKMVAEAGREAARRAKLANKALRIDVVRADCDGGGLTR